MARQQLKRFVLESIAVTAGILMAFGIDAAWEARTDGQRRDAYVGALASEVRANVVLFEGAAAVFEDQLPVLRAFYESVVTSEGTVGAEDLLTMLLYMGPRGLFAERTALTDLLNSGGLGYLDSAELRRAIADYDWRLSVVAGERDALQRYWEGELKPYYTAHASMPDLYNSLPILSDYELQGGDFSFDTSAFVGSRTFANLFSQYQWHLVVIRNAESAVLESAGRLEALLSG